MEKPEVVEVLEGEEEPEPAEVLEEAEGLPRLKQVGASLKKEL